jgi:hypothetical protein
MIDLIPAKRLKDTLTRYALVGGVVDYLMIWPEVSGHSLEDVHRSVALFGMRVIDWREQQFFAVPEEKRAGTFYKLFWCGMRFDDLSPASFTHLRIDDEQMSSHSEDPDAFRESHRYAFFNPPYNLWAEEQEIREMFDDINENLIGDLNRWNIRRWSDDWSGYFELGLEWWGAFLWTLVSSDCRKALWIGASTTD